MRSLIFFNLDVSEEVAEWVWVCEVVVECVAEAAHLDVVAVVWVAGVQEEEVAHQRNVVVEDSAVTSHTAVAMTM